MSVELELRYYCTNYHDCPRGRKCKTEDYHEYDYEVSVLMDDEFGGEVRIQKQRRNFYLCPYLEIVGGMK